MKDETKQLMIEASIYVDGFMGLLRSAEQAQVNFDAPALEIAEVASVLLAGALELESVSDPAVRKARARALIAAGQQRLDDSPEDQPDYEEHP